METFLCCEVMLNSKKPSPHAWACSLQVTGPFHLTCGGSGRGDKKAALRVRRPGCRHGMRSPLQTPQRNPTRPLGQSSTTGVRRDASGRQEMILGSKRQPQGRKRTGRLGCDGSCSGRRETCSHLARAPPAGRGAELRRLVQLRAASRSPATPQEAGSAGRWGRGCSWLPAKCPSSQSPPKTTTRFSQGSRQSDNIPS